MTRILISAIVGTQNRISFPPVLQVWFSFDCYNNSLLALAMKMMKTRLFGLSYVFLDVFTPG